MSEDIIQIPPDSTGKMLRAIKRTVGTNEVYEKTILVAEPISGVVIDPRLVFVQSGYVIARVSGETIIAQVSGQIIVGKVSGETLGLMSGAGPIIVRISGETVRALSSGEVYVAKVSGETIIAKVSGEVVSIYGHSKDIVSGAVIRNIKSGQCILHTVTINDRTSGYSFRIRDASSGAAGSIIAQPYAASRTVEPSTLLFDCVMLSGIVVDTSGATWHITVTYR